MVNKVFISYRREQGSGYALLLYVYLRSKLPDVFRDINCLRPGDPFANELVDKNVECDRLIAVITKGWAEELRKNQALGVEDWVFKEVQLALKKGVIPVLCGGAAPDELKGVPQELADIGKSDKNYRVADFNTTVFEEKNYDRFLSDLARCLWRWPPVIYWLSSILMLFAVVTLTRWLRVATAWGETWWGLAAVVVLGWLIPNAIVLSGRFFRIWPGAGPLRRVATSIAGPIVAFTLIGAFVAPAIGWRTIAVECPRDRPSATYQMNQGALVWADILASGGVAKHSFPIWSSWSPVELTEPGSHLGLCVSEIPGVYQKVRFRIPNDLRSNAVSISADEVLSKRIEAQARDGNLTLKIRLLFGDRESELLPKEHYAGKATEDSVGGSCSPRPDAAIVIWTGTENSNFEDLKRLVEKSPKRYPFDWKDGTGKILLRDSEW